MNGTSGSDVRTTSDISAIAIQALAEDAPDGDLTTVLTVPAEARCRADLRAKAEGVLAGTQVAQAVFDTASEQDGLGAIAIHWLRDDGDGVRAGDLVAVIEGPARTVLRAERVAINFLGHLSGVATLTRAFVEAASPAKVLCTRKTTPGLRALERGAVLAGGGTLHRASLSGAVLIKDNHLRIAGSVTEAVRRAHGADPPAEIEIEVEVETIAQLDEAIEAGAERILLDNPTPELVREAVARVEEPERLEVSGGVTLDTVGALVAAGARVVSTGQMTHSAPSLDLSLEVVDGDR